MWLREDVTNNCVGIRRFLYQKEVWSHLEQLQYAVARQWPKESIFAFTLAIFGQTNDILYQISTYVQFLCRAL